MPFIRIVIGNDHLVRRRLRFDFLRERRADGLRPIMLETVRPAV